MAFDQHTNFAYGTISNAPGGAGLSIILQAGQGGAFPAASFNATVWPAGVAPVTSNAEIVRCTTRNGDTLTVARHQENSAAINIAAGYQIAAGPTAKTITDLEAAISAAVPPAYTNVRGYSGVVLARAGSLTVVQRPLYCDDTYITAGSAADQHAGVQSFINDVCAVNGVGEFPACAINLGNTPIVPPLGTGLMTLRGQWGQGGPASSFTGGTKLYFSSDVAGAPHTLGILDLRTVSQSLIENIAFQGVVTYPAQYGGYPCRAIAINTAKHAKIVNCSFQSFSSAIVGGRADGSNGVDHSTYRGLYSAGCGNAFTWLKQNTSGDMHFEDINTQSYCAGMSIAGDSAGIIGSAFFGVGLLAPIPIYRYYVPGMGSTATWLSNFMYNVSFEAQYHASVYDNTYLIGNTQGFFNDNVVHGGCYALTTAGDGWPWSKTFTAVSGAGTVLTLTDGSGFAFESGMTVSDGGVKIPAGTVIAPGGVAGTWPWSTVTLTLSQAVTGTPTNPVVVSQPSLGSFVIGSIQNNRFDGNMMTSTNALAGLPYYVPGFYHRNNKIMDGMTAYKAALLAPLVKYAPGTDTIGNVWGDGGLQGGHGRLATGETCAAGDLLQFQNGTSAVTKANGTRQPVGVALRAQATAGGNVDFLTRAEAGYGWPVMNYGAAIPAYALLAPDAAHPGGVTTAASLAGAIGINGATIIATGSAGAVSELWCRG